MTDREDADGLITNAFQHVLGCEGRDYADLELEEIVFSLTMALTKIRKLVGGEAAYQRIRSGAACTLAERDLIARDRSLLEATERGIEDIENGRFVRYESAAELNAAIAALPQSRIGSARDALREALDGWELEIGGWRSDLATAAANKSKHERIAAIRAEFDL